MTTTLTVPWLAIVRKHDPDFFKERRRELEYDFTRRRFYGDPDNRGAYGEPFLADQNDDLMIAEDGTYLLIDSGQPLQNGVLPNPSSPPTPGGIATEGGAPLVADPTPQAIDYETTEKIIEG